MVGCLARRCSDWAYLLFKNRLDSGSTDTRWAVFTLSLSFATFFFAVAISFLALFLSLEDGGAMTVLQWIVLVLGILSFIGAVVSGMFAVIVAYVWWKNPLSDQNPVEHARIESELKTLGATMVTIHQDLEDIKNILREIGKKEAKDDDNKPDSKM